MLIWRQISSLGSWCGSKGKASSDMHSCSSAAAAAAARERAKTERAFFYGFQKVS